MNRLVILFLASAAVVTAQNLPLARSFLPGHSEDLSPLEIARIAYYLGGGTEAGEAPFLERLQASMEGAAGELSAMADLEAKAEALLAYLHREVFKRYVEPQTRIDVLYRNGTYNCVSSSLVYMVHARHLGLEVSAVATKAHAFCLLELNDGRTVDVETTNLYGFDPGTKREFIDSFGRTTGFSYVPPGNYRDRTTISERQLLGLLIQNLIVETQDSGRMQDSLQLAVDRIALEGGKADLEDFYQAANNVVSSYNGRRAYAEGLQLALEIQERYGAHVTLQNSIPALASNYVNEALRASQWDEAERRLEGVRNVLSPSRFNELQTTLEKSKIGALINSGLLDEAAQQLQDSPLLAQDKISLEAVLHGRRAQELVPEGWERVWRYLKDAPQELRTNAQFRNYLATAENNYAIQIRNEMARLANDGKFEEAELVIENGLAALGDNRLLTQARAELQRVRRSRNP